MKECKFCNWLENGDFPEDRKNFIDLQDMTIPIKQGNLSGEMYISAQVFIGRKNGKQTLGLFMWDDYNIDQTELCAEELPINFCPMCGRILDLQEVDDGK